MQLALSLPMTNAPEGDEEYEGEPIFCKAEEGVSEVMKSTAGKILLLSDEDSCGMLTSAACSPRAISVVFDGDCLPLFSMPEIACVIGAGSKETLFAARFYAEVERLPCAVFPTLVTLSGALEARGKVRIGGEEKRVDLKSGRVYCDGERMSSSLSRAYARLLLARLEEFEARALTAFGIKTDHATPCDLPETTEELIRENAKIGELSGEGGALSDLLEQDGVCVPEWRAYLQLSALYAAFFEKGKPRRYFTPDYKARAKAAGVEARDIPDPEEYARRAIVFERIRAPLAKEILAVSAKREKYFQTVSALSEEKPEAGGGDLMRLKYLPERHAGGLSGIIRDFGLMEWE